MTYWQKLFVHVRPVGHVPRSCPSNGPHAVTQNQVTTDGALSTGYLHAGVPVVASVAHS